MTEAQIEKLATMLNPATWKNPEGTIRAILASIQAEKYVPDYRETAKLITRSGVQLTKDEKKNIKISPIAKITTSIYEHFTVSGLSVCIRESQIIALAISAIVMHFRNINAWGNTGINNVAFAPAPDACPACLVLARTYAINKCPVPVLDTHLECRCSVIPV